VAAAFNAPAGAVVFVLEEMGALAWGGPLLWRAFISAVVSAYVIDFALSGLSTGVWGRLTAQGMFSFGLPPASDAAAAAWAVYEIPLFAGLGVVGGLAGAAFNALSVRLTRLRLTWVAPHRSARVAEVVAVTLIVSATSFFVSQALGACVDLPKDVGGSGGETPARFFCPPGQFSDLASLWFVPPEEAIRLLFHLEKGAFSFASLGAFWALYLALMCLTAGIAVPTGHFLPAMLAGCALGRLVGEVGAQLFPGALASPGSYAVIGAACMLGGIMHLSLSMTVILLEATGNTLYSLPLMVTLLTARAASSLFGAGLYEAQVAARCWPLLEERLPKPLAFSLRACDVMSTPARALREVERVGTLIGALRGSPHNGFPVVFGAAQTVAARAAERAAVAAAVAAAGGGGGGGAAAAASRQPGTLAGYIQRRHIAVLLAARAFHKEPPGGAAAVAAAAAAAPPPPPPPQKQASGLPRVPSASSLGRARGSSGEGVRLRVPSVTERHVLIEELIEVAQTLGSLNTPPSGEGSSGGKAPPAPPPPRAPAAAHHFEFSYEDEPLIAAKAFTEAYPRFPNVLALEFTPEEQGQFVDLRPYMDSTPLTVPAQAPLERAYQIFTKMGLRHLIVTDDAHNAVGIITRRDLVAERCSEVLRAVQAAERRAGP
jgi:H+/Cl- antiporter ClcA/CBS domain-containing protein